VAFLSFLVEDLEDALVPGSGSNSCCLFCPMSVGAEIVHCRSGKVTCPDPDHLLLIAAAGDDGPVGG